jgi:hypothetical protein
MIRQLLPRLQTEGRHMAFHRIYIIAGDGSMAVSENINLAVLKGISPNNHFHRILFCSCRKRNPRYDQNGCQKKGAKTPPFFYIHLYFPLGF